MTDFRRIPCVFMLLALLLVAQQREPIPTFDAASLKVVSEDGRGMVRVLGPGYQTLRGGPGSTDPGRVVWAGAVIKQLFTRAWGVDNSRLIGPDWIDRPALYRLEATLPPDTTMAKFQIMLQNLLIERFRLKIHHEIRPYPGYKLVVAPGGPKLTRAVNRTSWPPLSAGAVDAQGCPILREGRHDFAAVARTGAVCISYQDVSMAEFSQGYSLIGYARLPDGSEGHIIDATGLAGRYDFTLRFDSSTDPRRTVVGARAGEAPNRDDVGSGLPNIFTALERQLGLRLQKVDAIPMDSIVVDSGNPVPTEN